ncbi:MAG: GNAT family N-acetyltransferase [Helicobacteraceae bacterium]|jgi:GNAT superfamily N-acetyltransferase|nr:GNAT family N-acetyltransferase [Helicobacteraceae bacterium]
MLKGTSGAGPRQEFTKTSRPGEFKLEPFTPQKSCAGFQCAVAEYNEYLVNDALCSMYDHIALTWLLTERSTGKIAAYMSLIMDAIKLSFTEKELHNLNYPFKTIPAMKIAKLAVDDSFSKKYKGIGTFMIDSAERLAWACNTAYCAARFLTVDADIEHDEGVLAFYEKNGFIPNTEFFNKNRKTISMRKDIYY